jgi:hypothetical protein
MVYGVLAGKKKLGDKAEYRLLEAEVEFGIVRQRPSVVHYLQSPDEEIDWKRRAKTAEHKLRQLHGGIARLLKQTAINSSVGNLAEEILDEAEHVMPSPSNPPPPAPAERPEPNVPSETNEPPSPGRAQKKQPR